MSGPSSSRGPIRFSVFEVDIRAGELRKQGIRLKLQDQPFRVLQILLEHSGDVVTRDELQRQIWPSDTFVDFDRGLNNAVKRIREAPADSAEQPRYIQTLHKRGYRFIAPVSFTNGNATEMQETGVPVEGSDTVENGRTFIRRMPLLIAGGVTLLLLVVLMFRTSLRDSFAGRAATVSIRSIAVLPLQNLSGASAGLSRIEMASGI